jgi:hypothetical protein
MLSVLWLNLPPTRLRGDSRHGLIRGVTHGYRVQEKRQRMAVLPPATCPTLRGCGPPACSNSINALRRVLRGNSIRPTCTGAPRTRSLAGSKCVAARTMIWDGSHSGPREDGSTTCSPGASDHSKVSKVASQCAPSRWAGRAMRFVAVPSPLQGYVRILRRPCGAQPAHRSVTRTQALGAGGRHRDSTLVTCRVCRRSVSWSSTLAPARTRIMRWLSASRAILASAACNSRHPEHVAATPSTRARPCGDRRLPCSIAAWRGAYIHLASEGVLLVKLVGQLGCSGTGRGTVVVMRLGTGAPP